MSALCQKTFSINVGASCVFIQDAANDSIRINGGVAYSPQRQEILAVSGNTAALYPITALTRIGGAKVVMAALGRGVVWCPSVSKYYITLNNNTVRGYDPAAFTFDAAIALPSNGQGLAYAPTTDRVYVIAGGEYIVEVNPHTNVGTQVFDGGGVDNYGYQVAYASSINAIVGTLQQGTSMFGWIFSLPGLTMGQSPPVVSLIGKTIRGATWDSTRNNIWMASLDGGNIETFYRVDPITGLNKTVSQGNAIGTQQIQYDQGSDAIYFSELSSLDFVARIYKLPADGSTLPVMKNDTGFLYETGVNVVVANSLFFTGCFKSAGAVSAIRSCAVGDFP